MLESMDDIVKRVSVQHLKDGEVKSQFASYEGLVRQVSNQTRYFELQSPNYEDFFIKENDARIEIVSFEFRQFARSIVECGICS